MKEESIKTLQTNLNPLIQAAYFPYDLEKMFEAIDEILEDEDVPTEQNEADRAEG